MDRISDLPRTWPWPRIANGEDRLPDPISTHFTPPANFNSSSQPIIAVQNILPPAQIPVAMASIMFSRNFTAALLLSFSDTLFTNSLKTLIPKYTPSINPQSVINAGATGFRTNINERDLANVLVAYAKSLDRVFGLAAGAAVGCFVFAWGMGWYDIRRENKISKALSRA